MLDFPSNVFISCIFAIIIIVAFFNITASNDAKTYSYICEANNLNKVTKVTKAKNPLYVNIECDNKHIILVEKLK